MGNGKNKKDYIYSLRINAEQHKILKINPWIKRQLNEMVLEYLEIYSDNKKR